ncbi:putative nuclease HARBI1 [Dreissena polymorpha]|uniref:putative nuclease HARBI1 n=1 Tax=Dreissena polymorpha TaxID=45954 RepID=UPI0022641220|nr:putative nuclease HARBI1 [Dreissena polymorpha]
MAERIALLSFLLDEFADNSEIEQIQINNSIAYAHIQVIPGVLFHERNEPVRVEGYAEQIVPLYTDIDFRSHFRLQRSTYQELCEAVAPFMVRERSMSVDKRILATLWMLGNQESYRSVADRFGISKGTLHLTVIATCRVLSVMMEQHIKFPESRHELKTIADGFQQRCGMPGVVGAVDGTHIACPAPISEHRSSFFNRKGFASLVLQVVCDSNLKFLDIYTGWPGSVHDARVYRNSPVAQKIENLPDEFHVLGDSAYPLTRHLLVPYRDNGHLDQLQKKFNKCHSSTRVDVERAIGLLKCKFRRLEYLDMLMELEIPVVISACCVLHNFILQRESDTEPEDFVLK